MCICTQEQCDFVFGCKTISKKSKYIYFFIFKTSFTAVNDLYTADKYTCTRGIAISKDAR